MQAHVGMNPHEPTKLDGNDITILSHHPHILCQLCFVFVSCVHREVVEGSVVGSAGCGVHVDVHGE